ncbi:MAG: hypothetical protein KBA95_02975, partial [Acidobacteria bacterium]|nr:hypothetical protein [Acidobacteriota bacterium]
GTSCAGGAASAGGATGAGARVWLSAGTVYDLSLTGASIIDNVTATPPLSGLSRLAIRSRERSSELSRLAT